MPLFLNLYGTFPSSFASNPGLFLGSTYTPTLYTTFKLHYMLYLVSDMSFKILYLTTTSEQCFCFSAKETSLYHLLKLDFPYVKPFVYFFCPLDE